ncbi:MAG: Glycosyltransferase [Candidatus Woesebacteria bacterium GW2011_GWA1_39_21b]|uniref:Glycosyltransferase n=2 Tax=Candidatus Woeseibacteriota TaxID=1752722 RepID=A0A0G0NEU6_9BACT|nr:MAG: Glycosyltransferase [Microgenomates group bacterium GW2011_GWC1_38_12]KKR14033.1 MAG: Glycosyltransferase [Candidatus Woesebacteria bacterium GW2011_GWA1_39_21b]OGM65665.1 MAG: hypothetical protein A3A52_02130 [Candidatus Woesebacteria bacterium RIFCSPLOWO2_01_FULL_39_14]
MGLKNNQKSKIKNKKFIFFALSPTGTGLSGSDRIFIELAREWSKSLPITIHTTQEGMEMIKRQKLKGEYLKVVKVEKSRLPGNLFLKYFYKIYLGIKLGFSLNLLTTNYQLPTTILYSSSDFWMDILPAVILKILFKRIKWVATWYQTAPNPLKGYEESQNLKTKRLKNIRQERYNFSAFLYWFSQLVTKPLISRYADKVIVNNVDEQKQFPSHNKRGDIIVLLGAVPLDSIHEFLTTNYQLLATKLYDAVFQGRFHPQKGVVELIDVWKKIVEKKPDAKLAMIGDGPLMSEVKKRITMNKLTNNIELFGYLFDGPEKYKIFSQSKIVVHPAFYDSGGMASAEAMAFGIPGVGFNLKAYESYYPRGMVKVKTGDLQEFVNAILNLLDNKKLRYKLGREAQDMIEKNWSWNKRANELLLKINA